MTFYEEDGFKHAAALVDEKPKSEISVLFYDEYGHVLNMQSVE